MTRIEAPVPLLPEILALHGRWRGACEAVVCGERRESWAEFSRTLNRCAGALHAHGIEPRERVAVLMSNELPMLHALFGIMTAGAVSVPINVSVADSAVLGMIRDAGATAVVASPDQRSRIDSIRDGLGDVRLFALSGDAAPGWTGWRSLLAAGAEAPPNVRIDENDLLNIIYSSGTTGDPKGIAHTHRGRRDWAYDLAIALRYHGSARTLLTIGLYSNISWVAMLCTLLAGGTLVLHRRFDALAFLETVQRERITHTAMVPIQYQRVMDSLRTGDHDVASLQAIMSCGSPLYPELRKEIFRRIPCGVIELYGLTEGVITTLEPEEAEGRWSSAGKPLIGTDIRIIGNDGQEVARGGSGEIVSRGRIMMPGYYMRPDATAEAVWIDELGRQWLRTGDIGRLDAEGFLYVVDRRKDMILSGGQNVYPADIEAVMLSNPDVAEVAVIGVPSVEWGETPLAIVVPRDGASIDESELVAWTNARVGRQQRISGCSVRESLPRNPNGKVLKRELRAEWLRT
jgi:acyl-CoA synthetase (AMP-forming)/AMP-acid ligase II